MKKTLKRDKKIRLSEHVSYSSDVFRLAMENAPDLVIITDSDGTVIYGNKAVEKTTGYQLKDIMGKKAGAFWKSPMSASYYNRMWDVIKRQKKIFRDEIQNKRKNGKIYISDISISPVLDKKKKIKFFVALEHDITRDKEIDKAKTEFVSLASHQLRTPLSTINWYAEMLLAGDAGKLNNEQKKYLDEIYTGNQRMVALVNALLNVSRLELGSFMVEPQPTNLVKLIQDVLDEQAVQIFSKKIVLKKKFSKTLPILDTDPKLLHMVFQNLLSNAVKYTPPKGTVSMSLALSNKKSKDILFTISDTGYGIPKKQQDRIFEKLFRADNVRAKDAEGTGLGLYIAKAIVAQSKGKIWFQSPVKGRKPDDKNPGTTFFVSIPLKGMKKKEGTKRLG